MRVLFIVLFSIIFSSSIFAASSNSPTIDITSSFSSVEGDSGQTQLTLNITSSDCPNKKDIKVEWFTSEGTAKKNVDYVTASGEVIFSKYNLPLSCNPSSKTKTISINIIGDTIYESDENLTVNLQISSDNSQHYTEGVLVSNIKIINDDNQSANTPPIIDTIEEQLATKDEFYSLDISTYTHITSPITSYTLSTPLPSGLDFNSTNGVLHGTPDTNDTYTLNVYATNENGDSDTVSFNLIVLEASTNSEPVNNADDLCYEPIETNGFCFGFVNMMCTITTPIVNQSTDSLSDVGVVLASTNMFSAFSDCGVDEVSGNCEDSSAMSMMSMSALNSGISYTMPDYDTLDTHTTYTSAMFSFMNTAYEWLGTYTKNGTTYKGVINPCGVVRKQDPLFEACGLFPSALNTWDKINAKNNDEVVYSDVVNANEGVDGEVGCSEHPLENGEHSDACEVGTMDITPPTLPDFINSALSTSHTASGTQTDAQYGDVTIASNENVTFSSDTTYIDNSRRIMLIKSLTIHENVTVTFDAGDYYIGEWDSDKRLRVRTNGAVRLFINADMRLSDNFLDFNYDNDNGTPNDMFIFVNGSFTMTSSGGGNDYNMVAYIFTNGTFNAGTNTHNSSFRGAVTAVGSITLNNNQTYTYDDSGLNNNGFGDCDASSNNPSVGKFDAWQTSILDRDITTKIVNQPFNLTLASLNDDLNETLQRDDITIKYKLYDYDNNISITEGWSIWNITQANPTVEKSFSDISSVYKDARVRFKYCQEINTSVVVDYARCYDDGYEYNENISSTDNFAIRPDKFKISTTSGVTKIKLNNDTNLTFEALSNSTKVQNYNEHSGVSFKVEATIDDATKNCFSKNTPVSFVFSGGKKDITLDNFDVGDWNISISELSGYEFANVDADDTSDAIRYITPFSKEFSIIPDRFELNSSLVNSNTTDDFTYISDDLAQASKVTINIKALKGDATLAKNYSATCYAKDLNITLGYEHIAVSPTASITQLKYTIPQIDKNDTLDINSAFTIADVSKALFTTNGGASFDIKINFDRDKTKVVNPFKFTMTDINISDKDTINGSETKTQNSFFIYGRTNSSRQTFVGNTGSSNIYFEVYCNSSDCNKTLLQNKTSPNLKHTNDMRWFINENHSIQNDGTIGIVTQKYGNDINITTQDANPSTAIFSYNKKYSYPYKTTIENNASSWLIYNPDDASATKNSFQVEFIKIGEWTGKKETDTTTKNIGSAKINRRTIW